MTNKEKFIKLVDTLFESNDIGIREYYDEITYWEEFKAGKSEKPKKAFTENGKKILEFMRKSKDEYENLFTAKMIGEGLFCSSKSVSGAMRKLVNDGYVSKIKGDASLTYSITELGETVDLQS